jgi:hypothetical protein
VNIPVEGITDDHLSVKSRSYCVPTTRLYLTSGQVAYVNSRYHSACRMAKDVACGNWSTNVSQVYQSWEQTLLLFLAVLNGFHEPGPC